MNDLRSRMELPIQEPKTKVCANCGHDHRGWEECPECECTQFGENDPDWDWEENEDL